MNVIMNANIHIFFNSKAFNREKYEKKHILFLSCVMFLVILSHQTTTTMREKKSIICSVLLLVSGGMLYCHSTVTAPLPLAGDGQPLASIRLGCIQPSLCSLGGSLHPVHSQSDAQCQCFHPMEMGLRHPPYWSLFGTGSGLRGRSRHFRPAGPRWLPAPPGRLFFLCEINYSLPWTINYLLFSRLWVSSPS